MARRFGVNLTLSRRPGANAQVPAWIETALEEGVRHFESAGDSPEPFVEAIHRGGALLMHKCPSVRHAAERAAAGRRRHRAGGLRGGRPSRVRTRSRPSSTAHLRWNRFGLPLVLGGGIGSGRQIAAALALGADGVVMGSRFMVAREVRAHEALKRRIVEVGPEGSTAILGSIGDTWRVLHNDAAREVKRLEAGGRAKPCGFRRSDPVRRARGSGCTSMGTWRAASSRSGRAGRLPMRSCRRGGSWSN